ncbi:MAG: cellulase family glycosylhydrolase [Rikenellaceae bacterium]
MRQFIKTIILSVVIAISLSCGAYKNSKSSGDENITTPEIQTGLSPLSVDGTQLVDRDGEPVVLHGVSYGWHVFWPRFYNAESVAVLKGWGANVVRAALGVEPDGGYLDKPEWSAELIYDVVDAAIENEIYVIVDWHSHNINLTEAKAYFAEVATRYKGVPNVIYEIFNEPDYESWVEVKAYSKHVIKTIRDIDPDALILVGSPTWDQDVHIAADDPITEYDNLMYTLHFYAATHKQSLRDKADYALSKGLPLFISECAGMESSGDGYLDQDSWREWREWAAENSVSWVAWSLSDKDETCSMLTAAASDSGPWDEDVLKPWAQIVRANLRGEDITVEIEETTIEEMQIYLCIGQSNMEGQGAIESQDVTCSDRLKMMPTADGYSPERKMGEWCDGIPPLSGPTSGLSPADYFGRTMVEAIPDQVGVGLITVAIGGCDIRIFDKDIYTDYLATYTEDWFQNKVAAYGSNPYGRLIEMAKIAQEDGEICGVILHQGETNTGDEKWGEYVKKIYTDLLADLSLEAEDVPLIAGQVVPASANGVCASMNAIIDTLPEVIPTAYVISSEGCAVKEDCVHFDTEGIRMLGERYAEKMIQVKGIKQGIN